MPSRSFSIHGKGIKFETREDIEPYLKEIRAISGGAEDIHFGGNTLGVEPCRALAETLKSIDTLKASGQHLSQFQSLTFNDLGCRFC